MPEATGVENTATETTGADPDLLTTYGDALADAHTGSPEHMGERLIRAFLMFWEDPAVRPQLLDVFRSATTSETGASQLRDFVSSTLFARVAVTLNAPPMNLEQVAKTLGVPPLNLNAAAAQVLGVIMLRYVLQADPIASASEEELVDLLAPTIQRYLTA